MKSRWWGNNVDITQRDAGEKKSSKKTTWVSISNILATRESWGEVREKNSLDE